MTRFIVLILPIIVIVIIFGLKVGQQNVELRPSQNSQYMKTEFPSTGQSVLHVHADEGYYKDQPSPEQIFRGFLREEEPDPRYPPPNYPFSRDFRLVQQNGTEILVEREDDYGILARLLGRYVEIRGKLVDRTAEGGRRELWVGYISTLNSSSSR